MLKTVLCLLVAAASALPVPGFMEDAYNNVANGVANVEQRLFGGAVCTGTTVKVSAPACYAGKASILGGAITETVTVDIKKFDGTSKGTMDIHATGALKDDCVDLAFTKSGLDVKFDTTCLHASVTTQFCGDQNEIHLVVPVKGLPSVNAILKSVPCS